MLVNAKEMLIKAKNEKYAVAQININNLEWTKATLEVVQENNSPVILGVTSGAAAYMGGFKVAVAMVKSLIEEMNITVPVAIHLDHGASVEIAKNAMDAGFTSVMYDGSELPIEENIANTKQVVEYAATKNVSVEAEVGTVGGTEDGVTGGVNYASLEQCMAIAEAGIDYLAASLGSVHGDYHGEPNLGFDEMVEYSTKTNLPLVLHGGSGIPEAMIKKAIASGEAKINVNTQLQQEFAKGIRQYIEEGKDQDGKGFDPRKLIGTYAYKNIKKVVLDTITIFGSVNKG